MYEVKEPFIKIPLEGHWVIIDTETDSIYVDGNKLNTAVGKVYSAGLAKRERDTEEPKRRIKLIETLRSIIVIDVGHDGRVFFLAFDHSAYAAFRGQPKKQYSYWHSQGIINFYEDDLKAPAWRKAGAS